MGFIDGVWAIVGSLSGGKRKPSVEAAQHTSPAKRSRQNSPCKVARTEDSEAQQPKEPLPWPREPTLPPVGLQQQEQLPEPFLKLFRPPEHVMTFERRSQQQTQNPFKQQAGTVSPLSRLPTGANKPRSNGMKYFARQPLQTHGGSPVIGWTSGTPQQQLRSQPRMQRNNNSSKYRVNHVQQESQRQQPQAANPNTGRAALSIFGPEVAAATPAAGTPDIAQRLFDDPAVAGTAANPYKVKHGPAASIPALANGLSQQAGLLFAATLGQEAPGLGLGLRHSPANFHGAPGAGAAPSADGLAAAVSSYPLLFAGIAAPSSTDDDRLRKDIAAAEEKLNKKLHQEQTFASTYREVLGRSIHKALSMTSDYKPNPAAGSVFQEMVQRAARLQQEADLIQQQRQRLPTSPVLQQLQKPLAPALAQQQQRVPVAVQQQQQQQQQHEEQQEQSSDVICIDDEDDDEDVAQDDQSQVAQESEQSQEHTEEASEEGSADDEYDYSDEQDAEAAMGQLHQLHLVWMGPPSDWTPTEEGVGRFRAAIRQAGDLEEILASHGPSNIELTRAHFGKLARGEWLNDEIINMYIAMLMDRDREMRKHPKLGAPKCHFFNTFFLNKLYKDAQEKQGLSSEAAYCYNNVRRWTTPKKLAVAGQASDSVFKLDRIILPVHEGLHWTAAMVDLVNKRFVFFDSLRGRNQVAITALKRWLTDEAKDKLKEDWNCMSWPELYPSDIPRQTNGCDCGVFSLLFCNRLGAGMAFDFDQPDLLINARVKIACELLDGKLALPER